MIEYQNFLLKKKFFIPLIFHLRLQDELPSKFYVKMRAGLRLKHTVFSQFRVTGF